jgi:hypothetical protein
MSEAMMYFKVVVDLKKSDFLAKSSNIAYNYIAYIPLHQII